MFFAALSASGLPAETHATLIVGPATYTATTLVDQRRGAAPTTPQTRTSRAYAGRGRSSTTAATSFSVASPGFISGNQPTEARAVSTDTELSAFARASGSTQFGQGVVASVQTGHWFATPFATLFMIGYAYVAVRITAEQSGRRRRAADVGRSCG